MARLFAYDNYSRPTSQYSCQQDFRTSTSYTSRPSGWMPSTCYTRYLSHYPPTAIVSTSPAFKYSREFRPFSHHASDTSFEKDEQRRPYSSDYLRRYLEKVSRSKDLPSELTTTLSKSWLKDSGVEVHTQTSSHTDRRAPTPRESCCRVQEMRPRQSGTMVEPVTCSSSNNEVADDPKNPLLQEGLIFCQPAVLNSRVRSPKSTVVVPHPCYVKMVNQFRVCPQTQPRPPCNPLCHVSDALPSTRVTMEALPARQRMKRSRSSKTMSRSNSGSKLGSKRSGKPVGEKTMFTNVSPWDTRSDNGDAAAVQKCSSVSDKRHTKRWRSRARGRRTSKLSPPKWKTTKLKASPTKSGRRYSDVLWDTRWVTNSQVNDTGKSESRSTSTPKFRIKMDYVNVDTHVITGKGFESPKQRIKNIVCSMALPGPPGTYRDLRFPLIHPIPSNSDEQKEKLTSKYSTLIEVVKIGEKRKGKKKSKTVQSKESLSGVAAKNLNHEEKYVSTLVSKGPHPLPFTTKEESKITPGTVSDSECHETAEKGTDTYDPVELLKRFKEYIGTTRGKGRLRTTNIQVKAYPSADVIAKAFKALPKTSQQIGIQPFMSDVLSEREINTDSSYVNTKKTNALHTKRHRKKKPSPRRGASAETSRTRAGKTSKHKKDISDSPAVSRKRRT